MVTRSGSNIGSSTGMVYTASELLIVASNELGGLARVTSQLSRHNINIESISAYAWGNEAAFRLMTSNNRMACDLLQQNGFNVQDNPVTVWVTENRPGKLNQATAALAESQINTASTYLLPGGDPSVAMVVFTTDNIERTADILNRIG